jgi:hypothetical protein
MRWGTANRPADDAPLLVVHIETPQDMHDLKAKHADFHEGALSILTYPTAPPQGFLSHETPKIFGGGVRFLPGAYITKDNAGNFGILHDEKDFHES